MKLHAITINLKYSEICVYYNFFFKKIQNSIQWTRPHSGHFFQEQQVFTIERFDCIPQFSSFVKHLICEIRQLPDLGDVDYQVKSKKCYLFCKKAPQMFESVLNTPLDRSSQQRRSIKKAIVKKVAILSALLSGNCKHTNICKRRLNKNSMVLSKNLK